MKFKFGTKQIVLAIVAVLLIGVLVAGNIVLNLYSPFFHAALATASSPQGAPSGGSHDGESPYEYAARVAEEAEEESIVLLKNDTVDDVPYLPRPESTKFSIFGWGATDQGFLLSGGGSGGTNTNVDTERRERVTLLGAFKEAQIDYCEEIINEYNKFSQFDADFRDSAAGATNATDAYRAADNPDASFYSQSLMNLAKEYSTDAIVVLCRWGNENGGNDELKKIGPYSNGSYLKLTDNEKTMLQKLQDGGFNVTVLLNTTNPIEMSFLDDYSCIKACLYIGLPGQTGARAIPNMLVGSKLVTLEDGSTDTEKLSPSGRLSDTLTNDWQSFAPSFKNVGMGGTVSYTEGLYVGYKWYETAAAEGVSGFDYDKIVRYPFGYGLSYTTFTQKIASVTIGNGGTVSDGAELDKTGTYTVTVNVKNTGDYPAKDVVQLYFTPPYVNGGVEMASVNLLAFAKTNVLAPGESEEVTLTFTAYELASYDAYDLNDVNKGGSGYEIGKGDYVLKLMKNAHELYGDEEDCTFTLQSTNGFAIENDPFTGTEVKNLFTGDTAYANMPVDGSKGIDGGVTYLSRKDHFANYDKATAYAGQSNTTAANAKSFDYKGYDNDEDIAEEVASYEYGAMNGSCLTTLEDGSTPAMKDLNGNSGAVLTVDKYALETLIADPSEEEWKYLLDQVEQTEIGDLVAQGFFKTIAIESIAKPQSKDKDGPSGFNDNTSGGDAVDYPFYPTESTLGCSWNIDTLREMGRAQGKVGVQEGLQGWYGPGVNLHRSPFNSRNYEYYSEDGVLSGWLAAGVINGAKEEGVYCYLKHFALAESGQNSDEWFEWITEQALRENYCKPFELAVKISIDPATGSLKKNVKVSYDMEEGALVSDENGRCQTGANAMMSAFNCVGGIWSGYNHALLTTMLREEWGFQGSVITDYGKGYMHDYGRALKAGNNIWMNSTSSVANINFSDVGVAYGARQALKGIVFTYLDTIYTSGLETTVASASPYSPLFVTLWALIDVVLVLGVGACVLFMFWSPKKKAAAAPSDEAPAPEPTSEPEPAPADTDDGAQPPAE